MPAAVSDALAAACRQVHALDAVVADGAALRHADLAGHAGEVAAQLRRADLRPYEPVHVQLSNQALDQAEADPQVRVIVIVPGGAGRAFSSSFDLKAQMEQRPEAAQVWREILDLDFDTTMRVWNSPKPTIAAVHGACLAGAFGLAITCDITIASEDAVFGEPELKFGAGIVTMLLPWMTSPKQATCIILSADDRIPAPEALAMGLVSRVAPPGTQLDAAMRAARGIALMDRQLVMQTKQALNRSCDIQGLTALRMALDIDHGIESHGSPDERASMDVAREPGMPEAIAWRDVRFDPTQPGH
jgi:enoyl-CoA hydratase